MGRTVQYDAYVLENRKRFFAAWLDDAGKRRAVRSRPRAPGEIELLDRLACDAWKRALESGELEATGPRRYRLRV